MTAAGMTDGSAFAASPRPGVAGTPFGVLALQTRKQEGLRAMKLVLVLNSLSGHFVRGDADGLAELLSAHPAVHQAWPLDETLDARIGRAMEDGADAIAVGGGDGTIRSVAEVLYRRRSQMALLPLPLGTANLLTHRLYSGRTAEELLDAAVAATPRPFLPGLVNNRLFLVAAALGFPSIVARARERLRNVDGLPPLPSVSRRLGASLGHAFRPRIRYRHEGDASGPARASGLYIDLDLSDETHMRYIAVNWRHLGDVVRSGFSILSGTQEARARGQAGETCWIVAHSRKPLPAMVDGEPVFLPRHVRIRRASQPIRILDWPQ